MPHKPSKKEAKENNKPKPHSKARRKTQKRKTRQNYTKYKKQRNNKPKQNTTEHMCATTTITNKRSGGKKMYL